MSRIILFGCRTCAREIRFEPVNTDHVRCPSCQSDVPVRVNPVMLEDGIVRKCVACGHDTLYVQKDFNRTVGLAIVIVGSLGSLYFFSRGQPLYAILSLVGMAAIDFVIYSIVNEVTVCYACHAIYRGFQKNPEHETFDLKNLEKYGGRDPRF